MRKSYASQIASVSFERRLGKRILLPLRADSEWHNRRHLALVALGQHRNRIALAVSLCPKRKCFRARQIRRILRRRAWIEEHSSPVERRSAGDDVAHDPWWAATFISSKLLTWPDSAPSGGGAGSARPVSPCAPVTARFTVVV